MKCFGIKEKKRTIHCKIVLLDETELIQEIQDNFIGHDILDVVFKHLNLLETAYFGLRFINSQNQPCWLDANKNVVKQIKGVNPITLYFGVKFYASDPCKLLEEITRYQFFLQLKQDILQLRLPVPLDLAAQLLSYSVQSELGDYDPRQHESGYISEFRLLPNQTTSFEKKVEELHKELVGQVPATAEMNFLERVKWLDLYGADLHPVLGEDNVEYFLGIAPSGVIVLRNKTKVGNYFWTRITKMFSKGKYFMLRVIDKSNCESTYGFELPNKQACKHLLKCCIDHQEFFKFTQSSQTNNKLGFVRRSNQKKSFEKDNYFQNDIIEARSTPSVIRVPSRRYQRRLGQPDGADAGSMNKEETFKENGYIEVKSSILKPTLNRHDSSPVIYSVQNNSVLNSRSLTDIRNDINSYHLRNERGLFSSATNPSPRSIRSTSALNSHFNRIPSIDSNHSSRSHRRNSRQSDNESEISRCSRSSRHSRNSHHRCRHRKSDESGNESDSSRKRHRRRHKSCNSRNYTFVESEDQWKEVLRKQEQGYLRETHSLPRPRTQNAVVRHVSGYINSGMESDSQEVSVNKMKRKQRSRSKSPEANRKDRIAPEVRKHIEYQLIDSNQLSEREKRDIKYTKVETESRLFKIRYSPSATRNRYKLEERNSQDYNQAFNTPNYGFINDGYNSSKINGRSRQDSNTSSSSVSSKIADSDRGSLQQNGYHQNGYHQNSYQQNGYHQISQNRLKSPNRLIQESYDGSYNNHNERNQNFNDNLNYYFRNDEEYQKARKIIQNNNSMSPIPTPRVKFQSQPDYYSNENSAHLKSENTKGNSGYQTHEMSTEL